ncbi:MAG: EfeM/EfeO family lipoprotein [Anaerolineae bacterium]|nr:EfeM/EfeO family lipoprotein [Anaerolineae bacterium]
MKHVLIVLSLLLFVVLPAAAQDAAEADLAGIRDYLIVHGDQMQVSTDAIQADAQAYFDRVQQVIDEHPNEDPYAYLWNEYSDELVPLLLHAKQSWILAHNDYELVEGIVAGVPSLAFYDTWIDAGSSCEEAPDECVEWTLELNDGRVYESPGNIFHNLLETTLWGTVEEYTSMQADLDGDGQIELGEALPEANMFLAVAMAMNQATAEMNQAIAAWEPTLEDTFTALLTMLPTMGEYFEEWKLSSFITGEDPRFVAQTRLVDIKGIATSLDVIYSYVDPLVAAQDAALDEQIESGFDELLDFLDQVYTQEQVGVEFSPEEADFLGTEAQGMAQSLAALVAQAAAALNLDLEP